MRPDLFAVAIDPLADRVLMSDLSIGVVVDYTDDDLSPIEPDMADMVIYVADDGEYHAAALFDLAAFTVH